MALIAADGALAEAPTARPMPGQLALLLGAFDLAILDCGADDFFVAGKAFSSQLSASETGETTAASMGQRVTHIIVTPSIDLSKFSGPVAVEWDSVSRGQDDPAFAAVREARSAIIGPVDARGVLADVADSVIDDAPVLAR